MDRPFLILNQFGDEVGSYKDQDRMLDVLHGLHRKAWYVHDVGHVNPRILSLVYVDENEEFHSLGYGDDGVLQVWFRHMDELSFTVRLLGADMLGLADYINIWEEWTIDYGECDCPHTKICPVRYSAILDNNHHTAGWGATRLEALAIAFILRKDYGQS